jgi:opacity protein-like surface antigen
MTRLVIVSVFVTLVCAAPAFADTPAAYPDKSLEFELGPDFNLNSSEGLGLAYRVKTSENRGWRFGLRLSSSMRDQEASRHSSQDTTFSTTEGDKIETRLIVQKLFYSRPSNGASFYWGIGPTVTYSRLEAERALDDEFRNETSETRWSAGLAADLGVEWNIVEQLSVAAHYRWYAYYSSSWEDGDNYRDSEHSYTSHTENTGFYLSNSNSVDLAVAFHF